jgi:hypothetical protein
MKLESHLVNANILTTLKYNSSSSQTATIHEIFEVHYKNNKKNTLANAE